MSLKANYFKLGLFVIGAIVAGVIVLLVIGSGRWFERKILIETYFTESVQGLDVGSKLKYKGVTIGEVVRIGFTYNKYQLDKPMNQRQRLVLVEAQLQPRLLGGRAAAGDLTDPENARKEAERGLRIRLTPLGITGTSYLELDYVDPPPHMIPFDWTPVNTFIPSAPSTLGSFVAAAEEIVERLHRLDIEGTLANLNKLMVTANARIAAIDTKVLSDRAASTLTRVESTLEAIDVRKLNTEGIALLAELRESNAELKKTLANPAWQKLPDEASAVLAQANGALARARELVADPGIKRSLAHLERTLGRLDRLTGGTEADLATTIENVRQITDSLRDLSEDAKRYPSNLLFGEPPQPLKRQP